MQSVKNYFKIAANTRLVLAASARLVLAANTRLVLAASARLVLAVSKATKLSPSNVRLSKTLSDELNTLSNAIAPPNLVYRKRKRFPALFGGVSMWVLTTGVSMWVLTTGA